MAKVSVVIRYTDGTIDKAPLGEASVETLLQASSLAREYSRSYGVVRASVFHGTERVTVFLAPEGVCA